MKKKEEMSLFGHLDELRKRLTVMVVVTLAVSAFLFTKAGMVMDYFLAINPGMELVFITPSELLVVYVQLSLIMALIIMLSLYITKKVDTDPAQAKGGIL